MLDALFTAMVKVAENDQVSDQVKRLLAVLAGKDAQKAAELIEMTQPDSPRSPSQKYRLTAKAKALLK